MSPILTICHSPNMVLSEYVILLQNIPFGEENALPARTIWQKLDLWSHQGIKRKLGEMAQQGAIYRKIVPGTRANERNVYYRLSKREPRGSREGGETAARSVGKCLPV
jgi:hypothetical protein